MQDQSDELEWVSKAGAARACQCREETIDLWLKKGALRVPEDAYQPEGERRGVGTAWRIRLEALHRIVELKGWGHRWHPELAATPTDVPPMALAIMAMQQRQIAELTAQLEAAQSSSSSQSWSPSPPPPAIHSSYPPPLPIAMDSGLLPAAPDDDVLDIDDDFDLRVLVREGIKHRPMPDGWEPMMTFAKRHGMAAYQRKQCIEASEREDPLRRLIGLQHGHWWTVNSRGAASYVEWIIGDEGRQRYGEIFCHLDWFHLCDDPLCVCCTDVRVRATALSPKQKGDRAGATAPDPV